MKRFTNLTRCRLKYGTLDTVCIVLSFEVDTEFNTKCQAMVFAEIDGGTCRGSLVKMKLSQIVALA